MYLAFSAGKTWASNLAQCGQAIEAYSVTVIFALGSPITYSGAVNLGGRGAAVAGAAGGAASAGAARPTIRASAAAADVRRRERARIGAPTAMALV